jgi:hypothetical protein
MGVIAGHPLDTVIVSLKPFDDVCRLECSLRHEELLQF